MRRGITQIVLSSGAFLAVSGCVGQGPFGGLWWLELSFDEELDCTITIGENWENAGIPQLVAPDNDIVFEFEGEGSPEGFYAFVTQGRGGITFLNLFGETYKGEVDGETLTANWDTTWNGTETTSVSGGAYTFSANEDQSTNESISLTKGEEAGMVGGNFEITIMREITYSETDEWDAAETGIFGSSVPADDYLVEDDGKKTKYGYYYPPSPANNFSTIADCAGATCTLTITENCTRRFNLSGYEAGNGGGETFDALEIYGQDAGEGDVGNAPNGIAF